ncbi:hypothetical protein MMC16_001957 [Acarospora aff. strigata]|nr:hypothetical protein [Acarospora aff. strigata]
MDWSLPGRYILVLGTFVTLRIVPPALWAGALTPVVTLVAVTSSVDIPVYNFDPSNVYWNRTWDPFANASITRNSKGSFSYLPGSALSGVILNAAGSATLNSSVGTHAKHDNSRYTYVGRSFGVGSSAGLVDPHYKESSNIRHYTYFEDGYLSNVSCIHNSSSRWDIAKAYKSDDLTFPDMYIARGALPNSVYNVASKTWGAEAYFTIGLRDDSKIVALIGLSANRRNFLAVTTGQKHGNYSIFADTQCEIFFVPTKFSVSVDTNNHEIAIGNVSHASDVDPTSAKFGPGLGVIPQYMMRMVTLLSMINTNVYTSVLGDVFLSSIANLAVSSNRSVSDPDVVLAGMTRSIESMVDDVLLAYASAQLMIAGTDNPTASRKATDATLEIPAVRIGQNSYIYGIAAINFILLAIFVLETLRTRGWHDLPAFDYQDLKTLVVGSSMGSDSVALAASLAHRSRRSSWKADPADAVVGKVKVVVERREHGFAIVPAAPLDMEMTPTPRPPFTPKPTPASLDSGTSNEQWLLPPVRRGTYARVSSLEDVPPLVRNSH